MGEGLEKHLNFSTRGVVFQNIAELCIVVQFYKSMMLLLKLDGMKL